MSKKPLTREEQFLAAISGKGSAPKPLTREEAWLAEVAENAGGGSWDDIEGKPFKDVTVPVTETKLDAVTLSGFYYSEHTSNYTYSGVGSLGFEAGAVVTVDIDGTVYSGVVKEGVDSSGNPCRYIGNPAYPEIGDDSGEDYCVMETSLAVMPMYTNRYFFIPLEGESHVVTITMTSEKVQEKIKEEALPNDIARLNKDGIIEKEALPEALRFGKETETVVCCENVSVALTDNEMVNTNMELVYWKSGTITPWVEPPSAEMTGFKIFDTTYTYDVVINGTTYTGAQVDTFYIGKGENDADEPFTVVIDGAIRLPADFPTDTAEVSVYARKSATTPLSDEYISENIARVADILDEGVVKQDVLPTALQFGEAATEILPETTFDCSRGEAPDDVNTVYFSSGVLIASPIQLGKTYEVCFDGERHEIKATSHIDAYTVLGDKNYSFDTYGFSVLYDEESSKVSVVMPIESTSTVKVALKAITYINSNYIKSSDRKTEMDGTNLFDATETTAVSVLNELLGLLRSNGYLSYPDE